MHDFLNRPKRHHVKEIPLAPILDLLTVVIFFLILSASFIEIRQNTLPPSSTITSKGTADSTDLIPLNPKLIMGKKEKKTTLLLKWFGVKPGQLIKEVLLTKDDYDQHLKESASNIIKEFKKIYPLESKIQLGWNGNIKYQTVLTVVDGVMLEIKDLIFLSPEESEILFEKSI